MATGGIASRRIVQSHASGRKAIVHIQQLTGVTSGSGFTDGGTWTDVPGLSNVPGTFKTWNPYEKAMAGQDFQGTGSRFYMRWRKGVNIRAGVMRMVYGNHIYRITEASNYDEANTDIVLYLQEWQPTGTVR
jgi:Phage head-tail joining protein